MKAQTEVEGPWCSFFNRAVRAFVMMSLLVGHEVRADDAVSYHASGPVEVDENGFPNSALAGVEFGGEGGLIPVYLNLYVASGSVVCPLTVGMEGTLIYSGLPPVGSPFPFGSLADFRSSAGSVTVQQIGALTMDWTLASAPTDSYNLGIGAISATGMPQGNKVGANVDVTVGMTYASSITVNVDTPITSISTYKLQPDGVRTAAVSGIVAVSYGDQDNSDDSSPNGSVSVTTGSQSQIHMSSADPDILVAGISAAGAVGPSTKRDGTNTNSRTVSVTHSGVITNSADSGIGIMATATGGQSLTSGEQAIAGPVIVNLTGGSISTTGEVGIGIFAISDGYPTNKKEEKDNSVAGGPVTVTLDQASQISSGTASSEFSIGILAVSAGTNALIDPFSSQSVNTFGTGDSGTVTVTNNGTITTAGNMSIGIAALSLGGAGVVTNASADEDSDFSYLGAGANSETSSGTSGAVTVTNTGTITTLGQSSFGIAAISTGGGGLINNAVETALNEDGTAATAGLVLGNGTTASGDPGHNAGQVTVTHSGSIETGDGSGAGAASVGIVAQSIGGNGGSAGGKASLFVGDKGGGGGDGRAVGVTTVLGSTIATHDVNSVGILAQSIGGGGGNGGNAAGLFVAVGGKGGSGGDGGAVDVELTGSITTEADHSGGVIAQSIGGGGGHGGGATSIGAFVDMSIGGKGGMAGTAGSVTGNLYSEGSITTTGNNSTGLHLQSVGGGGGTGGAAYAGAGGALVSATMALGGDGGNGQTGGAVTGSNQGTITTGVPLTGENTGLPATNGADSIGVLVQSIGGGGGHAGSAVAHSLAVSPGDPPAAAGFTLTFGGIGGGASNGGTVEFTNTGEITTWGDGSHGILGQSIGGGGGNGGDSTASSLLFGAEGVAGSDNIAFGGQGGTAGDGNSVTLSNGESVADLSTKTIRTYGQHAAAIVAQSIGGGGGNGSLGTAKAITPTSQASAAVTVGLGAQGGGGGNGGEIGITNYGLLATQGSGSQGILAQSIGGGGGNSGGGSSVSNGNTISVSVDVGAHGANAGSANNTSFVVENYGSITTLGGDGTGILAQSIGGGGGNGGSSDPTASVGSWSYLDGSGGGEEAVEDEPEQVSATYTSIISVGGQGGAGGAGGDIFVSNLAHKLSPADPFVTGSTATIDTAGARAYGILAQSISGGGGTGGAATAYSNSKYFQNEDFNYHATITVSGDGGSTEAGGAVTVTNTGEITTLGYSAHGMFAQSIGGGGGVGADGSVDVKAEIGLGIDINGASGTSGDGGNVVLNQYGKVETTGADAIGVFGQSISGGGGVATAGTSTPFFQLGGDVSLLWQTVSVTLGFNLTNTDSSDGGSTTINAGPNAGAGLNPEGGTIKTSGDWSHGIVAQSVGAGGGKGTTIYGTTSYYRPDLTMQLGAASGMGGGGQATVNLEGSNVQTGTSTSGYSAYGVVVQSIGGGGGIGSDGSASAIGTLSLGGTSSAVGGNGGDAILNGVGAISTKGDNAHAVIIQSIGGGGGIAGTGSSLTDSQATAAPNVIVGASGAQGNGGAVVLRDALLDVSTSGNNAYGIVAQSVGGGGGIATVANANLATSQSNRLGGNDSASGNGGNVNFKLLTGSEVHTSGVGAHAIVVQSIGGGGGLANPNSLNGLTTILADQNVGETLGFGGTLNVDVAGDISTTGSGAYGVVLQSIAGGGGIIGSYAGWTGSDTDSSPGTLNGTINFTQSGTIHASGLDSVGVFAQNTGAYGTGTNITLSVNGSVIGSSGIWVDGGSGNTINIAVSGSVTGTDDFAVRYTGSTGVTIANAGSVTGSISVGTDGVMNNSGVFNSGYEVSGIDAVVNNTGTLDPGGNNGIATETTFMGSSSLNNESTGTLKFDIYSGLSYDSLSFISAENQSTINGVVVAQFQYNPAYGQTVYTLINAGNITYGDLGAFTVTGLSPDAQWSYSSDAAHNLYLTINVVPEPGVVSLLLLSTLGLYLTTRRRLQRS